MVTSRLAASIISQRSTLGMLSSVTLPRGGVLTVDLLRPLFPLNLHLGPDELAEDTVFRLAEALDGDVPETLPDGVRVPTAWLRLAVANAVDRWFDSALDEGLVRADLALAYAEAGSEGTAAEIFAEPDVIDALFDLKERLDQTSGAFTDAIRAELARVAAASAVEGYDQLAREPEFVLRGGRLGGASGGHNHADNTESRLRALGDVVDLNPLTVPARVIEGYVAFTPVEGDAVLVIWWPFPDVGADHPVVQRLVARLIARASGGVLTIGSFEHRADRADSRFVARLDLRGFDRADVVVDVIDVLGHAAVSLGDDADRERVVLREAQRTFTWLRCRGARRGLERRVPADDAERPLLSELETVWRTGWRAGGSDLRRIAEFLEAHGYGDTASALD